MTWAISVYGECARKGFGPGFGGRNHFTPTRQAQERGLDASPCLVGGGALSSCGFAIPRRLNRGFERHWDIRVGDGGSECAQFILPETDKSDYGLIKSQWAYLDLDQLISDSQNLLGDIMGPIFLGKLVC